MRTINPFDTAVMFICMIFLWPNAEASSTAMSSISVPPIPSSFYGAATLEGAEAPVGTSVAAWINGKQYAETTVTSFEGHAFYALSVPGDDPQTLPVEGGRPGDTIVFTINGVRAMQTATWESGTNRRLDLTAPLVPCSAGGAPCYRVFLPHLSRQFAIGPPS